MNIINVKLYKDYYYCVLLLQSITVKQNYSGRWFYRSAAFSECGDIKCYYHGASVYLQFAITIVENCNCSTKRRLERFPSMIQSTLYVSVRCSQPIVERIPPLKCINWCRIYILFSPCVSWNCILDQFNAFDGKAGKVLEGQCNWGNVSSVLASGSEPGAGYGGA